MKKISVAIKEPNKPARHVNISDSLENLQKIVGGYIETFTFSSDACLICNEEGKLLDLPYNFTFQGENFVGTVILVGIDGDEFADMPCDFNFAKMILNGNDLNGGTKND